MVYLPKQSLSQLLSQITPQNISLWEQKYDQAIVTLSLPKFTFDYNQNLVDSLKHLGIYEAFDKDHADFSNISPVSIYIYKVLHKIHIEVDEKGTKATGTTAVIMAPGGGGNPNPEKVVMNVNKPFYFVITDFRTHAILFSGIVNNPNP